MCNLNIVSVSSHVQVQKPPFVYNPENFCENVFPTDKSLDEYRAFLDNLTARLRHECFGGFVVGCTQVVLRSKDYAEHDQLRLLVNDGMHMQTRRLNGVMAANEGTHSSKFCVTGVYLMQDGRYVVTFTVGGADYTTLPLRLHNDRDVTYIVSQMVTKNKTVTS